MTSQALQRAESLIATIPDFPEPGILFRDISPLLANADALRASVDALIEPFAGQFDVVADERVVFSKKGEGRFPEPGEVVTRLAAAGA